MGEDLSRFLENHLLKEVEDNIGYHLTLSIYYMYLKDAMEEAEKVEDGEIFDEMEIAILLQNVKTALEGVNFFKRRLGLEFDSFDTTELITLQGCTLEKGKIKGDKAMAIETAKMWLRYFRTNKNELFHGGQQSRNEVDRCYFLYEVGVYILFLCHEEVDYSFL